MGTLVDFRCQKPRVSPDSVFSELLWRVRAGENSAAEELVKRFEPLVRREVRLRMEDERLNRHFDSLDVSQSVFASFFARMSVGKYNLEEPGQLVQLLVAMARNKLASRARHEFRLRRNARRISITEPVALEQVVDDHPSPSVVVAEQELAERFRQSLTAEERELADLRSQGNSWPEIAERMGGNAQARRMQLSRAVDRAMKLLFRED
jgi:RNA polymerase sigma factor (sigma-70 family)